jgi:hypothetical protein
MAIALPNPASAFSPLSQNANNNGNIPPLLNQQELGMGFCSLAAIKSIKKE